jgi:type VI secretion system secreted protein VgrG
MARAITVDGGGLPPEALVFRRLTGREDLGRPFQYELELLSKNESLDFSGLVGQTLTVHVELPGSKLRHYHGLVVACSFQGWEGRNALYHAALRPSLWLLQRRAGCRIFQDKSVPDILRAILGDYGFPFDISLSGAYPPREYVVQYRESDFAFVSRLMEQEGIYYFFKHEAGKHTLVVADSVSAHPKVPGYEDIPFYPPTEGSRRERDHVERWQAERWLESTAFSLRDYDFVRPRANLEVKRSAGKAGSPELEMYDYPGDYVQTGEGERYARTRLEESGAQVDRAEGSGNARGLTTGMIFKLTDHPRQDQNREYLIVGAAYDLSLPADESKSAAAHEELFRCSFTVQPSATPFRAPRVTPRPAVVGLQTARVVGSAGEEIWTDKYGRVKLEFHWDRASPGDENSSCWVRVAQAWSGSGFGAIHIPRIGEEVVVSFLEGDPDRPLVVGHLYNADQMPPWALPANQTQSGFKSHSTPRGGPDDANVIRFEDKLGDEELFLQAQKNYRLLAKNDASMEIVHDEAYTVHHDETREVGHDQKLTVNNDQTIAVKANRTETVEKDETITVHGNRTETVDKDETITISGNRTETVDKDETITISGKRTETVSKDAALAVNGNRVETIDKDLTVSVNGARTASVSKDDSLKVDKTISIDGGDSIELVSGSAKLILKKDGTITIEGKDITVKGSGNINLKASGNLVGKGSQTSIN